MMPQVADTFEEPGRAVMIFLLWLRLINFIEKHSGKRQHILVGPGELQLVWRMHNNDKKPMVIIKKL